MKIVKSILLFILPFASFAQTNLLFHKVDTLKADFRSGGKSNDSLDFYFAEKQTTLPGGTQNNPFGKNGNDYFNFFQFLPKQYRTTHIQAPVFTALPHLGFMYSFGSGGLQYLNTDFKQTFRGNIHLGMTYNRQVSTTLYKQSNFNSDAFTLSLSRYDVHWNHLVEASVSSMVRSLNGGVVSDNKMLDSYGIIYALVNKSNSNDSSKRYVLHHQSLWNFFKNDSLAKIQTGLIFNNRLQVDRRVYWDTDSISKIYPFFINPNATRDLSQLSVLENGISYFVKTATNASEVGISRVYWIYKTNAKQIKNAINLTFNSNWTIKNSQISYNGVQNLIGQSGQFSHVFKVITNQKMANHTFDVTISQLLPDPFQRLYFSNTMGWEMPKVNKQGVNSFLYTYARKDKSKLKLIVGFKQMNKTYFFLNDKWRNDTLTNIQQFYVNASCNLNAGKFYLQPRITINYLNNNSNLLPKYDVRARVFWKSKMNNKEKYEVIIGSDIYAKSSYSLMYFDDRLSIFSMTNSSKMYTSVVQLDAFVGIAIDEMRFYFKFENIDNSWNPKDNRIALNYPVMPRILRIGLTWDFLN